jgi:hypothetical protein
MGYNNRFMWVHLTTTILSNWSCGAWPHAQAFWGQLSPSLSLRDPLTSFITPDRASGSHSFASLVGWMLQMIDAIVASCISLVANCFGERATLLVRDECWRFVFNITSAPNCQCSISLEVLSRYRIYIFSREKESLSYLRLTQWVTLMSTIRLYRCYIN